MIDGLLRRTEIANLIAAPKLRKTYLAMQLALSVASGQRWLGYFNCRRGDVLYVDCELHPETFRHRLEALARVMRVQGGPLQRVDVLSLRGRLRTIHELQSLFVGPAAHLYSLVILDALYRLVPEDFDENSNGKVTQLYDVVDRYAQFSGAAFVCIHHASKGNQWGKSVTDIGSGAGAQARAVHAHIIMRPHGVADAAVMDFALRSFPPQPSIAAKYEHPVWVRNQELNPADLKTSAPPTKPADRNWTPERFAFEFVNHNPAAKALIVARACDAGLGERQAKRLLELAADRGLIRLRPGKDKRQAAYVLAGKAKNARTAKKSKPGKDI
ncbi:MAG: AAA family ATPase [Tepidisphaeraceae bacterium]